jgi:TonB family protein
VKTKLAQLIGLLLLAAGVQAAQTSKTPDPASWKRYTVKNEEFSVTLPTLPAMVTNKEFSAQLKKERRHRLISTTVDGVTYSIESYENPNHQQSLQQLIAESVAYYGSKENGGRSLTNKGFPGREYLYPKDDKLGTEQFFETEERLYRFATHGAGPEHPGVKQFFSSINLGKKQQGIQITDGSGEPLETTTDSKEKVFTGGEVDKKVKLKTYPYPDYTDEAKSGQTRGTVVLRVVFTSDGRVTNIQVVQGLPNGLTEKAVEAAKKIKFIPATKDGRFVSMYMQLEYHFNLY